MNDAGSPVEMLIFLLFRRLLLDLLNSMVMAFF